MKEHEEEGSDNQVNDAHEPSGEKVVEPCESIGDHSWYIIHACGTPSFVKCSPFSDCVVSRSKMNECSVAATVNIESLELM